MLLLLQAAALAKYIIQDQIARYAAAVIAQSFTAVFKILYIIFYHALSAIFSLQFNNFWWLQTLMIRLWIVRVNSYIQKKEKQYITNINSPKPEMIDNDVDL